MAEAEVLGAILGAALCILGMSLRAPARPREQRPQRPQPNRLQRPGRMGR